MSILTGSIIFIAGLLIGSFLNVVIFRMNELHTIVATRSHCMHCKKEIPWYDLIPFLSFIILKTRCRFCGKQISWQYPLVELGTALLFLVIYLHFGLTLYSILLLLLSCFLIVIFVYDWKKYIIPDEIVWPAIIIALIYIILSSVIGHEPSVFLNSLIGAGIGGGTISLIVLITRGRGMGIGDIKLGFLVGLLATYPGTILALFAAFAIGAITGLILILFGKKKFKSMIPFGPFLIMGIYLTIFFGQQIIGWYLNLV